MIIVLQPISSINQCVLDAVNWIALACENVKPESVHKCFRKAGFLSNEGTNIDLPENALKEINEECVTANVYIEDFITFDNKLETHQTYNLVYFLEEEEKEEENNNDGNDKPQDSHHDTIDTDLDELPTPTYTKKGKEKRFYNKKWENDFPWLYFDVQRNGAFCKLCEKHAVNDSVLLKSTGGVFIKTPFNNFKKALGKDGKLNKHNDSASHIRSIEQERLTLVFSKNPVYCQILNQSSEECKINRKHFSLLFRSIYFLAKEEIAHTTKYEPLIKRLIMKSSESFENWIVTNSDRSTYISKATASELLCCASEILCKKLNNEVIGKQFSLMADESINVNNKSELSICIRFVKNNQPVEQFLDVLETYLILKPIQS
ncbi:hypothetical protein QTP88_012738 [Uroleucon formosanum]